MISHFESATAYLPGVDSNIMAVGASSPPPSPPMSSPPHSSTYAVSPQQHGAQPLSTYPECYHCKGNHFVKDCPQRKCYNCYGHGHFSRDCPLPPKPRAPGAQQPQSPPSQQPLVLPAPTQQYVQQYAQQPYVHPTRAHHVQQEAQPYAPQPQNQQYPPHPHTRQYSARGSYTQRGRGGRRGGRGGQDFQ